MAQADLQETPHVELLTLKDAPPGLVNPPALAEGPAQTQESPARMPSVRMPVFSIKEDIKHMPGDLWKDTKLTFTNPFGLMLLGTAGGASAALRVHVDETITDHYRHSRTCKAAWGDAANALGSPIVDAGVSLAWYYIGYQAQDYRTYSVGKTLISAYLINGASTLTLRLATNAHGPSDAKYDWPSGHTSCTFTLAAVLDHSYGPVVGVPMYAFAGWVGFERIDDRQHKLSDVIFGAALGLVVGHSVAAGHMPQIKGGYVVPYADPEEGTAGIAWWKSWK
jgi:membrane-associated phospholipid phosphatase